MGTVKTVPKPSNVLPDKQPLIAHGVKVDWKDEECTNGREAVDKVNGGLGAVTDAQLKAATSQISFMNGSKGVIAEENVTWSLNEDDYSISMPYVFWKNMTQAEKQSVDRFHRDLLAHEVGHLTVAEMVAKKFSRTVSGSAKPTRDSAKQSLKDAIDKHQGIVKNELDSQAGDNSAYDTATSHGANQSNGPNTTYNGQPFPGGNDVRLVLP